MKAKVFKNMVVGEPAKLVDLVDYDVDGIGRNLVFGNKRATLIGFAFSEEKGLVTSEAQGDIFVYVMEGILEVDLDGKDHSVHQGEYILLPKGLPHSLETDEKTKLIFLLAYDEEDSKEKDTESESNE